ncbi:MAG: hypothetical protein R3243_08965 [Arenibacter latericius]|nr:hypothetical protein [Arenibacter latericius]
MITKINLLTLALIISFYGSIQAQGDKVGFLEGVQATLNETFNKPAASNSFEQEARKKFRIFMLRTNDISMVMNADPAYKPPGVLNALLGINPSPSITSKKVKLNKAMYAEFDWDNKALSMLGKGDKGEDVYQYTDKEGYWYTPFDDPDYPNFYVKTNVKELAINVLKDLYEIDTETYEKENAETYADLAKLINLKHPTLKQALLTSKQKIGDALNLLLTEQQTKMVGFPVFIHWALMYSPDIIKNKFNVTETTVPCYNLPDACIKLTVASGKEKGKSMVFDPYDRLIFINSKNEGTVSFNYDRDLTVNLPPAMTFEEAIFFNRKRNPKKKKKEALEEGLWRKMEKDERDEKEAIRKAEAQEEIEKLRKEAANGKTKSQEEIEKQRKVKSKRKKEKWSILKKRKD